jgi:hypothetical protein
MERSAGMPAVQPPHGLLAVLLHMCEARKQRIVIGAAAVNLTAEDQPQHLSILLDQCFANPTSRLRLDLAHHL